MIAEFYCKKCKESFEEVIQNQKEFETTLEMKCPKCGKKSNKIDYSLPARFMGTFYGKTTGTAPSKRYSYKHSKGGDNSGSAV